jgi:hypothetical protein
MYRISADSIQAMHNRGRTAMSGLLVFLARFRGWLPICVFALAALQPGTAAAQEIDRLLAAVNGKVITELDLKIARTLDAILQFGKNSEPQSQKQELDQLITQELIRQEMENFPIPESDRSQVEEAVKANIDTLREAYAEIGGLPALLRQLGLEQEELNAKIRTVVLSEKFIKLRFGPFVTVTDEEVESYYKEKLIPQLNRRNVSVPPLSRVTGDITALLKEEKKNTLWYKWIDNVKAHSRIEYFSDRARTPDGWPR